MPAAVHSAGHTAAVYADAGSYNDVHHAPVQQQLQNYTWLD
jgi:hypothetical protein